jgi:hypothetical protein
MSFARLTRLQLAIIACLGFSSQAFAYTANKVWFEFKPHGGYRVYVNYTIPELKEYREAYVDFTRKKEAEKYYWELVRGAEFYPGDGPAREFKQQPLEPSAW